MLGSSTGWIQASNRMVKERDECWYRTNPEMKDGAVRTAIDTSCGVASRGGDLLDRGFQRLFLLQEITMKLKFNLL
ncbi:hypothetical protein ACSQ67_006741 [Phaseolus vulgaris]